MYWQVANLIIWPLSSFLSSKYSMFSIEALLFEKHALRIKRLSLLACLLFVSGKIKIQNLQKGLAKNKIMNE